MLAHVWPLGVVSEDLYQRWHKTFCLRSFRCLSVGGYQGNLSIRHWNISATIKFVLVGITPIRGDTIDSSHSNVLAKRHYYVACKFGWNLSIHHQMTHTQYFPSNIVSIYDFRRGSPSYPTCRACLRFILLLQFLSIVECWADTSWNHDNADYSKHKYFHPKPIGGRLVHSLRCCPSRKSAWYQCLVFARILKGALFNLRGRGCCSFCRGQIISTRLGHTPCKFQSVSHVYILK